MKTPGAKGMQKDEACLKKEFKIQIFFFSISYEVDISLFILIFKAISISCPLGLLAFVL